MIEHDPWSGFTPARAPSELREQVLRAARRALVQRAIPPTTWEWAWRSRALRLGWTAACLALLAGHLALTLWPRRPPVAGQLSELRDVLYLPPTERLTVVIDGGLPAPGGAASKEG